MKKTVSFLTNTTIILLSYTGALGQSATIIPMCAKFIALSEPGSTALIQNDAGGKYCDSEADILCASAGEGLTFLTTEHGRSTRKAWIDLKNAAQLAGPSLDACKRTRGEVEITFWHLKPNNPDGACFSDQTLVQNPLQMSAGQSFFYGAPIEFVDATKSGSQGQYRLVFGQPVCGATFNNSPLRVTAEADLNSDGLADLWTVGPSDPSAAAILSKLNKRQQWDYLGTFSVPFQLVFVRDQFGAVLNDLD